MHFVDRHGGRPDNHLFLLLTLYYGKILQMDYIFFRKMYIEVCEKLIRPTSRLATVDAWVNRPIQLLTLYYALYHEADFGKTTNL